MTNIDLHSHSLFSLDGEATPETLVRMAAEAGVGCFAVTDHDRAEAVPEALAAGARHGVTVVPGVEIDCRLDGVNLHLLGYGIDHADSRYAELWDWIEAEELRVTDERLEKIRALGVALDMDALAAKSRNGVIVPEMIAEVAFADPANAGFGPFAPFRPGGARSDNPYVNFYWDFCSPGKAAYVEMRVMPLAEAVELVRGTGGTPVLAHPGASLKGREDLLPRIVDAGAEGIEAYSSYHGPDQCAYWHGAARDLGVGVTCGSDYHGKTKPAIRVGGHGGGAALEEVREFARRFLPQG